MNRLKYPLTPELTYLVLAHLPVHDVTRVLTVNKHFFDSGIRHVWWSLPDARPLLTVLLSAPTHDDPQPSIPEHVPDAIKQRFDMYATCVREFGRNSSAATPPLGWAGVDKLLSAKPIAPAVRTIRINWDSAYAANVRPATITLLFLGGSTSSLQLPASSGCALSGDDAVRVLQQALELGSPLEELALPVVTEMTPEHRSCITARLGRLRELETLSLSARFVNAELLDELGPLPRLRALTFENAWAGPIVLPVEWSNLATAPDDAEDGGSFRSLSVLELRGVRMDDVSTLFGGQRSMLDGLTTLVIRLPGGPSDRPSNVQVKGVFSLISAGCPLLRNFTCTFPGGPRPFGMHPLSLAPLFALDLERVKLTWVKMLPAGGPLALHDYWPRLTHLVMPSQPFVPADLLGFSGRRTMQELQVPLSASREALEAVSNIPGDHPTSTAPLRLASDGWLSSADDQLRELFARFLFRCWPNVTLFFAESRPGLPEEIYDADRASYAKIKNALEAMRE
ncbi:hypothetical protein FRC08_007938 [Ceratobasidium sp. 394]|nr:hypothetical protein FRC08_007938 [Ceratobasidium sp. 394]